MDKENQKHQVVRFNKHKDAKPVLAQTQRSQRQSLQLDKNQEYKVYMKYIIASNAEYFQSKLSAKHKGKPKDIRFKMPCQTGVTIYKKDFKQKQKKFITQPGIKHDMSVDCIKTTKFLKDEEFNLNVDGTTTYQNSFRYYNIKAQNHRRFQKRVNTHAKDDQDVPRFLQTQNKTDFLNWAGKNCVLSMKPQHKSAATNLPFEAKSVYKADFEGKSIAPTPLFVRQPSFPKFGCSSQIIKSNYSNQFTSKKRELVEIDCRPKHTQANFCKHLKGTTEYKRQFKKACNNEEKGEEKAVPTLKEMQALIIELL